MNKINSIKHKIFEYLEMIKFEHTVFALPFALAGMLLAKSTGFPDIIAVIMVITAMVSGRTAAMSLNRLIDADIDKLNPRTQDRAIPAGKIKKISALVLALISFIILTLATMQLPSICLKLLPMAIGILILYSYTKRFTELSHFVLGAALGAAATGGWIAVSGALTIPSVLWGIAVMFWVAGFDIIYAIQDIDFDREHKLFSIPAKLGAKNSLRLSKFLHVLTVLILAIISFIYPQGFFYYFAIAFIAVMFIYEHSLINENDLKKINIAFFNVNGYVSIAVFIFVLLNKLF
ncbi:MAG: UbiA-like polyprenyltransferase [bacterium]